MSGKLTDKAIEDRLELIRNEYGNIARKIHIKGIPTDDINANIRTIISVNKELNENDVYLHVPDLDLIEASGVGSRLNGNKREWKAVSK